MNKNEILAAMKGSSPVELRPEEPNPAPSVSKSVFFECRNGRWEVSVRADDEKNPITQRDLNQLTNLLTAQRAVIKRKAALAYQGAIRSNQERLLAAKKLAEEKAEINKLVEKEN